MSASSSAGIPLSSSAPRRKAQEVEVQVVDPTGVDGPDFRGPAVQGKRGERFLYLTWGDVGPDGEFEMFRRAKLMLDRVDPQVMGVRDQQDPLPPRST